MWITGVPVAPLGSMAPAADICVSGVHATWIIKVGLIPTGAVVGFFQAGKTTSKLWKTTV